MLARRAYVTSAHRHVVRCADNVTFYDPTLSQSVIDSFCSLLQLMVAWLAALPFEARFFLVGVTPHHLLSVWLLARPLPVCAMRGEPIFERTPSTGSVAVQPGHVPGALTSIVRTAFSFPLNRSSDGSPRLECGSLGHHAIFQVSPQCNRQPPGNRNDHRSLVPLALSLGTSLEPSADRAGWLMFQP